LRSTKTRWSSASPAASPAPSCNEGYHDTFKQPAKEGVFATSAAQTEFKRRPDDNEETVRTRMAEYRAKTAPILPIYEARGLVSARRWHGRYRRRDRCDQRDIG
jgi:adenylate kinase family enzyme